MSVKPRTRISSGSKISDYVGAGQEFNKSEVPTNRAVIRMGLLLKERKLLEENISNQNYTSKELSRDLAPLIVAQWSKSNAKFTPPVIVTEKAIHYRIEKLWDRVSDVVRGRAKPKVKKQVEMELDKVMDLTTCPHKIFLCQEPDSKCKTPKKCKVGAHIDCSCVLANKVPVIDLLWLHCQRSKVGEKSVMQMGMCDKKETMRQVKALKRKAGEAEADLKQKTKQEAIDNELQERRDQGVVIADEEDVLVFDNTDSMEAHRGKRGCSKEELVSWLLRDRLGDLAPLVTRYLVKAQRSYMAVSHTAAASLRYDVSSAAAAAVATGYLKDLIAAGHLPADKAYLALDPSKVRRGREKVMSGAKIKEEKKAKEEDIVGIGYDGRKDMTRVLLADAQGKVHPRLVKEEHISVTWEPTGRYLSHFTPDPAVHPDKPAKKVAECLYDVLKKNGATESCIVIGGDSTNTNTGWLGGTHTHLECKLGHKCFWAICMKHTNEIKIKHLIEALDGPTSSKDGFTGPVCKLLSRVNFMPVNFNFRPLPDGEDLLYLTEEQTKQLTTDSFICYRYVKAIKEGKLPNDLANLKCGALSHARWLTTGEALLMMWTRDHGLTGQPLKNLETLVKFCIQMYFKLYFDISFKNRLEHGPYHVLTELRILKTLPAKVKGIVTPYVRTGAWFSHSECCLLSLLASEEKEDRKFGVEKILKIRGKSELGDMSVRPRKTPRLNLNSTSLQSIIPWKIEECHEPVFTCKLTKDQLKEFLVTPFKVPKFSIHTQSTERCVKMVTEAAASVFGQERRDGFIRSRIHHREEMPEFRTKSQILRTF